MLGRLMPAPSLYFSERATDATVKVHVGGTVEELLLLVIIIVLVQS